MSDRNDKEFGHARSGGWSSFRKKHIADRCAICGSNKKLELHHIMPFHIDRSLELDPNNVITLCEEDEFFNCHRVFGHLNNFRGWNPEIIKDAQEWAKKLKENRDRVSHHVPQNPDLKFPIKH